MKKRPEIPEDRRKYRSVCAYYKKKFGTTPPELPADLDFTQKAEEIRKLIKAPKPVEEESSDPI